MKIVVDIPWGFFIPRIVLFAGLGGILLLWYKSRSGKGRFYFILKWMGIASIALAMLWVAFWGLTVIANFI